MLSLRRKDEMRDAMRGEMMFSEEEKSIRISASAAAAAVEATHCTGASEPDEIGEAEKKTKLVRRKLTKEEIDRMLSVPEHRKPFPMVADWFLARVHDPAERARYMGWADVYYKSQEQIKREQQYVREEIDALGYVEREVEVTDDEDDAGDDN